MTKLELADLKACLRETIAEIVVCEVEKAKKDMLHQTELDMKEMQSFFHCSESTLKELVHDMPFSYIRNNRRYARLDDLIVFRNNLPTYP